MAIEAQRGEPFVYCFKPPLVRRVIPLAYLSFLLLCAAYLPLKVGVARFFEDLGNDGLWYLVLGLLVIIALGLRLAFPPRSTQPKLRIRHDSIGFIPGRVARHLFAEPTIDVLIPSQSTEILVCRRFLEELPDGDSVIVRLADGTEREVKVGHLTLDAQEHRGLSEGIKAATGLPVQFVIRRRLGDGSFQQTQWIPPARKTQAARGFAAIAIGTVPYIGGIAVGYLLPRTAVIVAVGFALWLGQMLAAYAFAHRHRSITNYAALSALTTLFTFGAAYASAVVVVAFTLHAR
jgi:hypothetical protein